MLYDLHAAAARTDAKCRGECARQLRTGRSERRTGVPGACRSERLVALALTLTPISTAQIMPNYSQAALS